MLEDRLNLLLIEDDEDDVLLVRKVLEKAGSTAVHLEWTHLLESGLKRLEQGGLDLLLLDLFLPDAEGLSTLRNADLRQAARQLGRVRGMSRQRFEAGGERRIIARLGTCPTPRSVAADCRLQVIAERGCQRPLISGLGADFRQRCPAALRQRGSGNPISINACCIGNVSERPAGRTSCAPSCADRA